MDAHRLRRDLRPGDVGDIAALHGRLYAAEHGLDATFEGFVAQGLGALVVGGWPSGREAVWIAEAPDGRLAGSIVLTDEGDDLGRVRYVILDPAARGQGLGRRMVTGLVDHARATGFARLELATFSALQAAAHLYREAGFERTGGERGRHWGRTLVMERYAMELEASIGSRPC